ncbi:hypothetical protein CCR75_001254 [Bremia lactucae]|uniref:Aquaporin n=1 Tax=Bremia lactucae TaxID=4779 RepID=A0A976IHV9_BRELC|nr:hypothetical protein CCR75_001254 [Bremia lactucae]
MLFALFRSMAFECASEFVGTFVMVFLGTASIATATFTDANSYTMAVGTVAAGWGFAAMLATFLASPGSGAHLNPAVTLAIAMSPYTKNAFPKRKLPVYILSQFLGATLAGFAVYLMFGSGIKRYENRLHLIRGTPQSSLSASAFGCSYPHPQLVNEQGNNVTSWTKSDVSAAGAFVLEAMGTLILVLTHLVVRHPIQPAGDVAFTSSAARVQESNKSAIVSRLPSTLLAPFYIGVALAALTLVMTPFTQACLNPARDLGPRIVAAIAGWGSVALPGERREACWVYLFGPLLGAFAGSMLHDVLIYPALQTRDQAAAAWMRHQQMEGEAILEQLEKSQSVLSATTGGCFGSLTTQGLNHSDYRESSTLHNFRMSSSIHLHPFPA